MNVNFKIALGFVAGAAIGAFAMKKYAEYKFQQDYEEVETDEMDEEIEEYDVTEDLEAAFSDDDDTEVTDKPSVDSEYVSLRHDAEYMRLLNQMKYKAEEEAIEAAKRETSEREVAYSEPIDHDKPYYIPQCDFAEFDEWEFDDYTYYPDGYVTDSTGFPVGDADILRLFGPDFATYFDKYGHDEIWIRNEQLHMDFSIVLDLDNFEDTMPPRIKRMAGLI